MPASAHLKSEQRRATRMLRGKIVRRVMRHRAKEVCVEFQDGMRLYVDWQRGKVELSIA